MIYKERTLDIETFKKLVSEGYNCQEIANKMGWHSHTFGYKMKEVLGMYPSVYIKRMKDVSRST